MDTDRQYTPQGPLDPAAEALMAAMSQNEAWTGLRTRPAGETRRMNEAMQAYMPKGPPLDVVRDLWVPVDGGEILARQYAVGEATPGLILWFHGGGFVLGSVEGSDSFARRLALASGCTVLSVDYRLAPEHVFPTPLDDVLAAIRWATARRSALTGGQAPLFVGGDSAGANLATVAAGVLRGSEVEIAGQILAYPCTDDSDAPSLARFVPPFLTREDLAWFFDQYLPDASLRSDPRFAPIHATDLKGHPPAVVLTAEHDILTEQAEDYGLKLARSGVPVEIERYPGQIHGFLTMDMFAAGEGGRALQKIVDFIQSTASSGAEAPAEEPIAARA
jgi:acetyl esterase